MLIQPFLSKELSRGSRTVIFRLDVRRVMLKAEREVMLPAAAVAASTSENFLGVSADTKNDGL